MADALALGASVHDVGVQVPSSAPRKGDNFDTKSIEIIALFVAFRGIFTLFSAFDGSFDR